MLINYISRHRGWDGYSYSCKDKQANRQYIHLKKPGPLLPSPNLCKCKTTSIREGGCFGLPPADTKATVSGTLNMANPG